MVNNRFSGINEFQVLLLIQIVLIAAVFLDVPVVRQIVAFSYLSFIPGFLILKILKLNSATLLEKLVIGIGLSLSFLMFSGFLINEVFLALNISQPLTSISLVISLSTITLALSAVAYCRHELTSKINIDLGILKNAGSKIVLLVPLILGAFGSLFTNVYVTSAMLISITLLFGLAVFSKRFSSKVSLQAVLFFVSLALAIQVLFTSKYILGFDANGEFYVFKLTSGSGHWTLLSTTTDSVPAVNLSSMLSVTILPTVYYSLMNCSGELVFKSLYPFVFSLVPVVLFTIYSKRFGKAAAFLASMFFVFSSWAFYGAEPLSLNRQIIGVFFLALSILVILDKKLSLGNRRILLFVFGAALVFSHYSLLLIYVFLVVPLLIISKIKKDPDSIIDFKYVSFLLVLSFLWYYYANMVINSLVASLRNIVRAFFLDFSITSSRGLTGSPLEGSNINYAGNINWAFLIIPNLLVVIGVSGLVINLVRKKRSGLLGSKLEVFCVLSGLMLLSCLIIPNLAPCLNFTRFYAIALLFLAPCFVKGGELTVNGLNAFRKRLTKYCPSEASRTVTVLLSCLLVCFFFSQSGFVNLIAGAAPVSFSFDYSRAVISSDKGVQTLFNSFYNPEQDVFSAVWLSNNKALNAGVYSDVISGDHVLVSYGLISSNQIIRITETTVLPIGSFLYLSSLNVVNGVISSSSGTLNISQIVPIISQTDVVYSNGNSEVRFVTNC